MLTLACNSQIMYFAMISDHMIEDGMQTLQFLALTWKWWLQCCEHPSTFEVLYNIQPLTNLCFQLTEINWTLIEFRQYRYIPLNLIVLWGSEERWWRVRALLPEISFSPSALPIPHHHYHLKAFLKIMIVLRPSMIVIRALVIYGPSMFYNFAQHNALREGWSTGTDMPHFITSTYYLTFVMCLLKDKVLMKINYF